MNNNPLTQTINYLKGVKAELAMVEWIKPRSLINYTGVVLAFTFVLTILIYVMDTVLVFIRSGILGPTSI